jgi:hypothetical protein
VADYSGPDSFRYSVTDSGGLSATATVTITVTGVVAAYSFDEGWGSTAADASGNANDGMIQGATWTQGKYGHALAFDGKTAWVRVANTPSLALTTGLTLVAWVYPAVLGADWKAVLVKEQASGPAGAAYYLYADSPADQPATGVFIDGYQDLFGGGRLVPHTWTHLAATYDGIMQRLYLNGIEVASRAKTGSLAASGGPLGIGSDSAWWETFEGRIDEVRLYNRALSAAELQRDMYRPVTPPPLGAYGFETGFGTRVVDASGNAHHGTSMGATWSPQGRLGAALAFDGRESYVTFPGTENLALTEELTLAAWIYPRTLDGVRVVVSKTTTGTPHEFYLGTVGDEVGFALYSDGWRTHVSTGVGLQVHTWTHIAAVYNDATDKVRLYVNGQPVLTAEEPHALGATPAALRIGIGPPGTAFDGYIDEVRLYNRALRGREIVRAMQTPVVPQPVAAYSFEPGHGPTLVDVSGQGNDGLITGALWTEGKYGHALAFDGENDRVRVADAPSLALTTGLTLAAWVYPTALAADWRAVLVKEQASGPAGAAYYLYASSPADQPATGVFIDGYQDLFGGGRLVPHTWTHLAATYDGVIQRLYLNGIEVARRAKTGSLAASGGPLNIGSDSAWWEAFEGRIDEVRLYNQALSAEALQEVMQTPVTPFSVVTAEGAAIELTWLASGVDVQGQPLTVASVSQGEQGTVVISPQQTVRYTPASHFHGQDRFTYTVRDSTGGWATATITVTVTPVNDAPVAEALSLTTAEDTVATVVLQGSDVDGEGLTYSVVSGPGQGTLSGVLPVLTYTPPAGFSGSDSLTYRVTDPGGLSATASVAITVTPVNDAPVALAQSVTTAEDTPVTLTLRGSDVDGDALTFAVVAGPVNGTLSGTPPLVTYTPTAHFTGSDSFTFRVSDGTLSSPLATVSLTVTPVNDAPVATALSITTAEDTAVPITLRGSDVDGDPLTFTVVTGPAWGSLSGALPTLTYTPNPNFHGTDSFTYTVADSGGLSATATVTVTVTAVNDVPVALAQSVTTAEDTPVTLTLRGSDVDGDALAFSIVTEPVNGTLSGTPPLVTYTPTAHFTGSDSFTFRVSDGTATSAPATVSLTVRLINGGFESGDFTGWSTIGETRIESAAFGSGPTEGAFQAFLSPAGRVEEPNTPVGNAVPAADLETFLALPAGSLDDISTGAVIEGSAIKRTFTARAGDVVSFDWNFLTDEYTDLPESAFPPTPDANDLAFVVITPLSTPLFRLADTFWTFFLSPTAFLGETRFNERFSFTIPTTGTYMLGIGIVDVGDAAGSSGLLIDNVVLTPASP